jgi:hypothetical protein
LLLSSDDELVASELGILAIDTESNLARSSREVDGIPEEAFKRSRIIENMTKDT